MIKVLFVISIILTILGLVLSYGYFTDSMNVSETPPPIEVSSDKLQVIYSETPKEIPFWAPVLLIGGVILGFIAMVGGKS